MIAQISGVIETYSENSLTVNVGGVSYEVYIPTAVMQGLGGKLRKSESLSLITYHYHQTDPSKSIPVLIGFANRIEKDFFEKFITVSGVGPKAAVRALSQPIPDIALAIDSGNLSFLKSLPGIGEQRAKEIIAKLQGKMGRFALMPGGLGGAKKAGGNGQAAALKENVLEEALEVLLQLQYKKEEARSMIERAFQRKPDLATVEEALNEVYKQRKSKE